MTIKAVVARNISEEMKEKMEALGYELTVFTKEMQEKGEVPDAEVAVGSQALKHMPWEKMTDLRAVFLKSVGIDYLPLDLLKERGIVLTNIKGAYSRAIGEWIVFSLLRLRKNDRKFLRQQDEKVWEQDLSLGSLEKKRILFLGTGSICQEAAKMLAPFRCHRIGMNTSGRPVEGFDEVVTTGAVKEILPTVDDVVVGLPMTEKTRHFVEVDFLKTMKEGAHLINIARGAIVDEEALVKSLEEHHLGGACLDVFEKEPLPKESPLWEMENVYVTPHNSFAAEDREEREFAPILENLRRYKKDGTDAEFVNAINLERGY